VFRIGHLGDFNDLMLAGTLSGIELGLKDLGLPLAASGVAAALDHLSAGPRAHQQRASAA
jgi:alanine-glyoxylate transaminase/serine-glyoxylate transaminase/serine-pyruvate transaminase